MTISTQERAQNWAQSTGDENAKVQLEERQNLFLTRAGYSLRMLGTSRYSYGGDGPKYWILCVVLMRCSLEGPAAQRVPAKGTAS